MLYLLPKGKNKREVLTMELLNLREVRDLLGFKSHKPVYYMINQGLPVIYVGKSRYVEKQELQRFLKSHTVSKMGSEK